MANITDTISWIDDKVESDFRVKHLLRRNKILLEYLLKKDISEHNRIFTQKTINDIDEEIKRLS